MTSLCKWQEAECADNKVLFWLCHLSTYMLITYNRKLTSKHWQYLIMEGLAKPISLAQSACQLWKGESNTINVPTCSKLKTLHHPFQCLWWTLVPPVAGSHVGNCYYTICWAESIFALEECMTMVHWALGKLHLQENLWGVIATCQKWLRYLDVTKISFCREK